MTARCCVSVSEGPVSTHEIVRAVPRSDAVSLYWPFNLEQSLPSHSCQLYGRGVAPERSAYSWGKSSPGVSLSVTLLHNFAEVARPAAQYLSIRKARLSIYFPLAHPVVSSLTLRTAAPYCRHKHQLVAPRSAQHPRGEERKKTHQSVFFQPVGLTVAGNRPKAAISPRCHGGICT